MMNKRNLIIQAAVSAALVATFGAANATSIGRSAPAATIPAYAGSYTIAAESTAANYAVNLDSAVPTVNLNAAPSGTIRWIPTFGLNTGDVCTFAFANARYMSADVKLMGEEAIAAQPNSGGVGIDINGDADITDVIEVASNFGTLDAGAGVTSVQVRINNGLNLPTGINLVLAKNATGGTPVAGAFTTETMNPTLRIPAGTAAGNVQIGSTCTTSGGLTIGAAQAINTIIDLETQFAMTVTPATSTIDVGAIPPRTAFVDETGGVGVIATTGDSSLTQSAALYTFNNDSNSSVEDFITLVAGDTLTVLLTSSTDLGSIATGVGANFLESDAAGSGITDDANRLFTLASPNMTSIAIPGTALPVRGASMSDDIVVTVNGSVIANRTFAGAALLNFAGAQYQDQTYTLGTTHTWTTNGTILHSPYFSNASGYISRFVLTNTGATAAPYTTVCYAETGNTPTLGAGAVGTVPAGGQLILTTSNVCTFSGAGRGAIEFTVAGPTTSIQGAYQITSPSGGVAVSNMMRPGTN